MAFLLCAASSAVLTWGCAAHRPPAVDARGDGAPVPAPVPAPEPEPGGAVLHVVARGESLTAIARRYGSTVPDLVDANALPDPDRLGVGQMLVVPGAQPEDPPEAKAVAVASAGGLLWPVPGGEILSRFGDPRPRRSHAGLDIRGAPGQEIVAAQDGTVRYSGDTLRGYGNAVILDHGDGVSTLYAHSSELIVGVGERVSRGQPIARVGRTGNATVEHCHFEVRQGDTPVDPLPYLLAEAP